MTAKLGKQHHGSLHKSQQSLGAWEAVHNTQGMWRFIDTLLEHGPQQMVGSDCSRSQQKARKIKLHLWHQIDEKPSSRKESLMELQDSRDYITHKAEKRVVGPEVVHHLRTLLL